MFLAPSSSRAVDLYLQTLLLRVSLSRLGGKHGKHRHLARHVGDSASSSANSTAGSSDTNNVPEGITLVFGFWACTADGSGGFSSHLVTLNTPKPKITNQSAEICKTAELDGKPAPPELSSDIPENVPTPTRNLELAESDTNSDPKNLHFFKTLRKYVTYLKSIKCPKIVNSELLDGVDRVSRSIEGCIKLAESTLSPTHNKT